MSSSHPRSRNRSPASPIPYISQPEGLILPDGPIGERASELLHNFVHPHNSTEDTLVDPQAVSDSVGGDDGEDDDDEHVKELASWQSLPWWKRPSSLWIYLGIPLSVIGYTSTIAPRVEIYTILACRIHRPEYVSDSDSSIYSILPSWKPVPRAVDITDTSVSVPSSVLNGFHPGYSSQSDVMLNVSIPKIELEGIDQKQCAKDPVVQGAVAKLAAVITTSMGILSCLTTAWWGSLSDRYGRTLVLGLSILGLLITDLNFIFVTFFVDRLPGGYWFLIVGPIFEGFFGGMASAVGGLHAYLADCVDASSRSRVFSATLGLIFTGMALGPILGGLVIRATQQALSVFYFAAVLHTIYAIFLFFIVPESVTLARRASAKRRYAMEKDKEISGHWTSRGLKQVASFFTPITILFPERVSEDGKAVSASSNPLKRVRRDWSLCLVAASYGFTISIMGSFTYKFQYAAATFGWSSEIISYYISFAGAARALCLAVILPIAIKLLKRTPPTPIQLPVSSSEPLQTNTSAISAPTPSPSHSPQFDLNLARVSVVLDTVAYLFMGLSNMPGLFVAFTLLGSMGAGFSPAVQSVALELYIRRGGKSRSESGRLFGALSVVQALSSQIISPAAYGFLYFKTVTILPQAIFLLSSTSVAVAFVLLAFVRIPELRSGDIEESPGQVGTDEAEAPAVVITREETLVDVNEDEGRTEQAQGTKAIAVTD